MFSTIISKRDGAMYHGYILKWVNKDTWIFGFRLKDTNYEWECNSSYWTLLI